MFNYENLWKNCDQEKVFEALNNYAGNKLDLLTDRVNGIIKGNQSYDIPTVTVKKTPKSYKPVERFKYEEEKEFVRQLKSLNVPTNEKSIVRRSASVDEEFKPKTWYYDQLIRNPKLIESNKSSFPQLKSLPSPTKSPNSDNNITKLLKQKLKSLTNSKYRRNSNVECNFHITTLSNIKSKANL